ncbi:hypothetical protein HOC50_00945 [archaeon]|jgi:hypothetical protein|nr:hypothetical protein [archaeon]MBT4022506.1 hypothetical protein [archaeon]MBT4272345.1 hypothetical protein [archaeon]MBT4460454.1 hypothetical protein [archaeon]MBT6772558.1 hypothetical protein [archaeon]
MVKAYMKTIEMLLVIVVSTIFLLSIMPKQESLLKNDLKDVLISLEDNDNFRNFCLENTGCFNSINTVIDSQIRSYLPESYEYRLCVGATPTSIPNTEVFLETLYFVGNGTESQDKTVFLYYWFEGSYATTNIETICDNNIDDDYDGLIDCADSDCSSLSICCEG